MMRKKSWLSAIAIASLLVLGTAGCSSAGNTSGQKSGQKSGPVNIAFAGPLANEPVHLTLQGAEAYAKAHNATVTGIDNGFSPQKQLSVVQDVATSGRYDALIVAPFDSTGGNLQAAVAAKVPIVTYIATVGPDLNAVKPQEKWVSAQVFQPWDVMGKNYADSIVKVCENVQPCTVAFMPSTGMGIETTTVDAMKTTFASHPNITMILTKPAGYDESAAKGIATDFLLAHPDINVFASMGDQTSLGIVAAAKEANLLKKVKIYGVGASERGLASMRAGGMYGTVMMNAQPQKQGELAAAAAIQAARHESIPNRGIVPSYGNLPLVLTQENKSEWADYNAGWQG